MHQECSWEGKCVVCARVTGRERGQASVRESECEGSECEWEKEKECLLVNKQERGIQSVRVRESEKEKEVGNANKRLNGAAQLANAIVVAVDVVDVVDQKRSKE